MRRKTKRRRKEEEENKRRKGEVRERGKGQKNSDSVILTVRVFLRQ
jgi:hypothetical protein